jgi:hypothetical protein
VAELMTKNNDGDGDGKIPTTAMEEFQISNGDQNIRTRR